MDRQQLLETINTEVQETLKGQLFPEMHIIDGIEKAVKSAIAFESPKTLNCTYETLKGIITKPFNALNVHEMGFALNAVGNRSISDFKFISPDEYVTIQDNVMLMAEKWRAIVNPLREAIVRKHETQARISAGIGVNRTPKLAKA